MAHDENHEQLVKDLAEEMEPIFSSSPQAIYLYLDDTHKICNQKFVDMVGYMSIDEWVGNETPVDDVDVEDQPKVIQAYKEASENYKASTISANIVRKNGVKVKAEIIMVPITYKGEVFVLHFISEQ
jgi:PAS domain S-box-containing protein